MSNTMPIGHLLSADGVGKMIGLTRQRVDQLAKSDPTFPTPLLVGTRVRAWQQTDIERWAVAVGRLCEMHRRASKHTMNAHGRLIGFCDDCVPYDVAHLGFVPHETGPDAKPVEIPVDLGMPPGTFDRQ